MTDEKPKRDLEQFFTAEDFLVENFKPSMEPKASALFLTFAEHAMNRANAKIREFMAEQKRVYGRATKMLADETPWDWATDRCVSGTDTHEAILVGIKKLEGEL